MKADLNDIFVSTRQCPGQQQLLDYIQGRLSPAEQHEVELHVADCDLCSDALEGLAAIDQKERIPFWVREMKWELLRKMRRNRRRRRSLAQPADYYIQLVLIVLAILFLLLAGFWAMYFFMK